MKTWLHAVLFVLAGTCLLGCPHSPTVKPRDPSAGRERSDVGAVCAALANAKDADADRLLDKLQRLDVHINSPDESRRLKLTDAQRDFLLKRVRLSEDASERELEEVESNVFSPLDAHYLEGCFLLRNPARAIRATQLEPLLQAQLALDWVCRQVVLCTPEGHSWIPPQDVLRSGVGNASDRALLFLDLLRQLRIEGCLLEGQPPLVGVLLPRDKVDQLYLFDPATGVALALPGPKGEIATLADVTRDPQLLTAVGLPAENLRQREFSLDAPLSALSPRMMVLEDLQLAHSNQRELDQIVLYIGPADEEHRDTVGESLQQDIAAVASAIAKIAGKEVRVGNPEPVGELRNSATRCLRWSLPPEDGGRPAEKSKGKASTRKEWLMARAKSIGLMMMLSPDSYLVANMKRFGLFFEPLPYPFKHEFTVQLRQGAEDVITKFAMQPRDMLLRWQWKEMDTRLARMQEIIDTFDFNFDVPPLSNELVQWGNDGLGVHDAKQRAQQGKGDPNEANARVYKFWSTDMLFNHLLNVDVPLDLKTFNPGPGPQANPHNPNETLVRPTMLTNVVFGMCKEVLGQNSAYLRAECAHEKAAAQQAAADFLRGKKQSDQAELAQARDGWNDAAAAWKFLERPSGPEAIRERLSQFHAQYPMRFRPAHVLQEWSLSCASRFNCAAAETHLARAAERPADREKHLQAAHEILRELEQQLAAQIRDADGKISGLDKLKPTGKQPAAGTREAMIVENALAMAAELHGRSSILTAYARLAQIRLRELAAIAEEPARAAN